MSARVVVLRPEPGNAATMAKLAAQGLTAFRLPLFAVRPLAWTPPDPAAFDAVLFTSANALRQGGEGLAALRVLPALAVGAETAAAAQAAGFTVTLTGTRDVANLVANARASGHARLLHLAGREHVALAGVTTLPVYAGEPVEVPANALGPAIGGIVLLHSARAARRFAELVDRDGIARGTIGFVAISPAVAQAAGQGWAWHDAAPSPDDEAMVALAMARAIDRPSGHADKAGMDEEPTIAAPPLPPEPPPRRGMGWRVWTILIVLAFLAGLGAMAYAAKQWAQWFPPAQPASQSADGGTAPQVLAPSIAPVSPAPPADLGTLATREDQLAAQLANLEARSAAVSSAASQAQGYATRAEGLMIAFAARRAIDRGLGLGYIEGQLRNRFGPTQPRAVATVLAAARNPVTIEDLRSGLDAVAPQLANGGAGQGWWASFSRSIGQLVVVHKADTPSPLPADRLTRARRMLEAGQVEPALAEVTRMPGAGATQGWIGAARHYVEARHALDALETAAVQGQAADTTPSPTPPGG